MAANCLRRWVIASFFVALPVAAVCQTDVRIQEIKNPGIGGTVIGMLDVATHFSSVLIIGVVAPLWIIATVVTAAEVRSWASSAFMKGEK
jgi:hypothetical protein